MEFNPFLAEENQCLSLYNSPFKTKLNENKINFNELDGIIKIFFLNYFLIGFRK